MQCLNANPRHIVPFITLLLAASAAVGQTVPGDMYLLREGQSKRASSSDPDWHNGNGDCRPIAPGAILDIADVAGPGVIRHIWFTIAADDPQYGRSLVLRMYWDGDDQPAVESPIGDFFAVGLGERRYVDSAPVAVTSDGRAYNCYWPMPFRKHARITLTNESKRYNVGCVYWYVDYEKLPSLPANAATFHAQYRQEYPTKPGKNYLILDTEGSGHYVGTVLSVRMRTGGWFGEGDDFFFIDGETEPSIRGTGTEDYFCDAWGFREFQRPYYGVVIFDGFDIGGRVSVYRWHIKDPVMFSKSLRLEIEHKGSMVNEKGEGISGFAERADLFSSVAFWYQTGKAKRFAPLPPLEERLTPRKAIELELVHERMQATPTQTNLVIQNGGYSDGKQVLAMFGPQDAKLRVPFTVDAPIEGLGVLKLTRSFDYGIWKVSLDGQVLPGLAAVDLFSRDIVSGDFKIGVLKLAPGEHELLFECVGRNPESKGHFLGVDALVAEQLTPFFVDQSKQ